MNYMTIIAVAACVAASALMGVALYNILLIATKTPGKKASASVKKLASRQNPGEDYIELQLVAFSEWLSKHIHINTYKRATLVADLTAAGWNMSPELYTAQAIIKAGMFLLPAIVGYFVFPLSSIIFILIGFILYDYYSKEVAREVEGQREKIELELPRFVATTEKTLMHSRNVLQLINTYIDNAGPALKQQFIMTVADMRTGNYESAITRMDARIGSPMMSDVCRGLIGIIHGDDNAAFWQNLYSKLSDNQRQILKRKAMKAPAKVKILSGALLISMIGLVAAVLAVVIMDGLGVMFA